MFEEFFEELNKLDEDTLKENIKYPELSHFVKTILNLQNDEYSGDVFTNRPSNRKNPKIKPYVKDLDSTLEANSIDHKTYSIHHIDGVHKNNELDNLIAIPTTLHNKINSEVITYIVKNYFEEGTKYNAFKNSFAVYSNLNRGIYYLQRAKNLQDSVNYSVNIDNVDVVSKILQHKFDDLFSEIVSDNELKLNDIIKQAHTAVLEYLLLNDKSNTRAFKLVKTTDSGPKWMEVKRSDI